MDKKADILQKIRADAFNDELEKLAINIKGLRKLQKLIKPKLIRNRTVGVVAGSGGGLVAGIVRGEVGAMGVAKTLPKEYAKLFPKSLKNTKGKILTGEGGLYSAIKSGGRSIGEMRGVSISAPKSKIQREAIGRVGLMHEFQETAHGGKKFFPIVMGSHNSPGVLMAESNLLASMPKKYGPTKRLFRRIRGAEGIEGTIESVYPGFVFGETRLSRAAKRHVAKSLKNMTGQ